jgi:hypothetical protein
VKSNALAREREPYLSSHYVVGISDCCVEDAVSAYGVPPEQVRTIWCQPRRRFTPTRGGVGTANCRRFGWASFGSSGSESRPSESRRRLDPPAHAIRRRSRRSRAQSESRPGSSVSAGAWIHPQASRVPTICGDRPELSPGCLLSRVEASGARRSSTFALAYRSSRLPWDGIVDPHGRPACGFRSRLTENGSPRPSPRFFESPRDMRR